LSSLNQVVHLDALIPRYWWDGRFGNTECLFAGFLVEVFVSLLIELFLAIFSLSVDFLDLDLNGGLLKGLLYAEGEIVFEAFDGIKYAQPHLCDVVGAFLFGGLEGVLAHV
jgi:hypothetical protein